MMKVVLITNVPAPYRVPVFNLIAHKKEFHFHVIFFAERYPGSTWNYGRIQFEHFFLKESFIQKPGDVTEIIHNNPEIFNLLRKLNPDVIINTGFNPTSFYAFAYSALFRKKFVPLSDGTIDSESDLTVLHRLVRKVVFSFSSAFIGASDKTRDLYKSYSVLETKIFKAPLCVDNYLYNEHATDEKKYDIVYCGRFVDRKDPLFAIEVIRELKERSGKEPSVLFVGKGPLEGRMRQALRDYRLSRYTFFGFASQAELPALYGASKVFLFPTRMDPWGVVVNEACATGLPVVTTPMAGAAGELVCDGENGFVCPLDVGTWMEKARVLLEDEKLRKRFGERSLEKVSEYTYETAANGIIQAVYSACHIGGKRGAGIS